MQLYYCPPIALTGMATLDVDESRHAVRVMRLHAADTLCATDGRGHLYQCRIVAADERACTIEATADISAQLPPTPTCQLHLCVAPTKNPARIEWLTEKATEAGLHRLTLVQCQHSERTHLKTERLHRIAISAMKQSLHATLPTIAEPTTFAQWIAALPAPSQAEVRLIAHCCADQPRTPLLHALTAGHSATVLIGPEGDFAADEIAAATAAGFVPVSLGPSRLRTETAALYATMAFNLINDPAL